MNKKSITILVVCLIVTVLSVSLAYYTTRIIGTGKNVSVNAKELTINFDNNNEIASGIIEPGWSSTNTFSVENKSKNSFTYDIVLKNYKNTTKTNGYLVYKITSTNGYNMTEYKDMPKDGDNTYDLVIARGITIEPGSSNKQSYSLEIKYLDSEEDQSIDMGETVTGSLYIVESVTNENNPYTKGTLGYQIMEDNSNIKVRTDFSTTYTDVNIGTMYKAQEDDTDVYYFAGDARNNWVKFGDYYWRIIRTNADGSIRLLYHGTSPEATDAYIESPMPFAEQNNDPMYVGYMYGTSGSLENNRTNTNSSRIKIALDGWYESNMVSYTKYLSTTAVYCNDREVGSGTYGTTGVTFYYAPYERINKYKQPTFTCTNINDKFTVDSSTGNGKLKYPIALLAGDEAMYAGIVNLDDNQLSNSYLNFNNNNQLSTGGNYWWTMSSCWFNGENPYVVYIPGNINPGYSVGSGVGRDMAVRPVISLRKELLYKSGDGSATNPYEVNAEPVNMYTVSLTVDNGSGTGTALVEEGKDATFTVTPSDGYKAELETNTCGGTLSGNTYTISNITSAKSCAISFKKNGTSLATLIQTNAVNEDGYRYEGSTPNNYITVEKTDGTTELWRIIGLFPDGENGENVIRVRKNEYESDSYDSNNTNHWPNTTLYTTLSSTYSTTNYKNTVKYKMYLGTLSSYTSLTVEEWYTVERGNTPGETSSTSYNSTTTFIGSVGLMYPSDYGYGVLASNCERTIKLYNYATPAACHDNNWLYQGSGTMQWLISPNSSNAYFAFYVYPTGFVAGNNVVSASGFITPVMALSASVTVTGSGTQSDPYVMTN